MGRRGDVRQCPGPLARRKERWFYLLIAPWLLGLVFLQAGPILAAFGIAFVDWPLPNAPTFAGLTHLRALVSDPMVRRALGNTALYALGAVPAGVLLSLALALALNRQGRIPSLFRALLFLPSVVSGAATVLVWGWVFHPRFGPVNAALGAIGIRGPGWLQSETWAMPTLILLSLWTTGASLIIYTAGLQDIPRELLEAAELDGAGRWARLRHITLPLLSPVTFFLLVSNTIAAFQVFTPSYLLTRGGPNNSTLTLPLYIYINAFSWNKLGYASALSASLALLVAGLTWLQFRAARRWVHYTGGAP